LAGNKNEAIVICFAALLLILDHYYPIWNKWFTSLLYFAVIPLIVIVVLLRRNPLDFGFRLGKPRIWVFHVVLFCLIAWPVLYAASHNPSLQSYYQMEEFSFISYFTVTFISLFATEFLFRGFLLFGLKDKFREGSILIQTIPFVIAHFGKPELETISTIITGVYFGYVCYRGNSYWPAFLMHMFINIFFLTAIHP
jgi:membrane protease YdiL (CAAX protease family)